MNEFGIKINHATLKHAQTLEMVERNHQKLKQILKIIAAADKLHWDHKVNLAIMAQKATYHQALICTPTETLFRPLLYNALDPKFSEPLQKNRTQIQLQTLFDEVNQKYKDTRAHVFEAFHKYKNYYDRNASAQPLEVVDYVFLLNLKYQTKSDKTQFKTLLQNGPYKVTKVLTLSNTIIRKTGTHKTKCLHCMQPRRVISDKNVPDIQVDKHQFYQDPDTIDEPDHFSTHVPTKTQFLDQHSKKELNHEMQKPQEVVIQLQPAAGIPPPLLEP